MISAEWVGKKRRNYDLKENVPAGYSGVKVHAFPADWIAEKKSPKIH